MKKGLLIILSGPSGVGKGTVRKYIEKTNKIQFVYSISMTTRLPRGGEKNGVDYYFVNHEEFQRNIDNNNFLEWAQFVGNRYGTPKDKVEELRNQGINVFLEIEINGATQVIDNHYDDRTITFFLMPPSLKKLEERIRNRKTESDEVIMERLEKGRKEMSQTSKYDFVVKNDRVKRAGNEIIKLILKKQNS